MHAACSHLPFVIPVSTRLCTQSSRARFVLCVLLINKKDDDDGSGMQLVSHCKSSISVHKSQTFMAQGSNRNEEKHDSNL